MLLIKVQLWGVTLVGRLMIGKNFFEIIRLIKFSTGGERL